MAKDLKCQFESAIWADASSFHDSEVLRLTLDVVARTLEISLRYESFERVGQFKTAIYRFFDVSMFALTQTVKGYEFEEFCFPPNALVDQFTVVEGSNADPTFILSGMYSWEASWRASACDVTVSM